MRSFLARDHPHPDRPGLQIQKSGDVGDPGAVTDLTQISQARNMRSTVLNGYGIAHDVL